MATQNYNTVPARNAAVNSGPPKKRKKLKPPPKKKRGLLGGCK